ncbi:MAG: archease [Pirellulaceae bacterium]
MVYEIFEHTADLGLRIRAATREALFVEAARAFFSVLVADLAQVRPLRERRIQLAGSEFDLLLFDWLNELLFVFETEDLLLSEFELTLQPDGLEAVCRGEPLDHERHLLEHEVKAVTYHELRVECQDGTWLAEVILDI